jgi:5-methylcytosine-specific restriction endonuclease McrBC regulatory subunit McrC
MLLVSERLVAAIHNEFDELVQLGYDSDQNVPWLLLLARPYMEHLELIDRLSLKSDRRHIAESRVNLRGQIDLVPTLANILANKTEPIECEFRTKTYMTLENRALSTAVAVLMNSGAIKPNHLGLASKWLHLIRGNWIKPIELAQIMKGLQARYYTGNRSYYIPALVMARIILAQSGITLQPEPSIAAESLLTNMPLLFEEYVRAVIVQQLRATGLLVEKITNRTPTLFWDGTCKLEPDIVISDSAGVKLLVDAKYHSDESIPQADYYQMSAYLDGFSTDKGMLVLPTSKSDSPVLVEHKLWSGKRVYEVRIPLADWKLSEKLIHEYISKPLLS